MASFVFVLTLACCTQRQVVKLMLTLDAYYAADDNDDLVIMLTKDDGYENKPILSNN